jgi:UDP-glucuronate decarboxylase
MSKLTRIELEDSEIAFKSISESCKFPRKSRWLVTGAGGFLGSQILNVLQEAIKKGYDCEIVAVDSQIRGDRREWYFDNVTFIDHDIILPWPDLGAFTHVLHLASIASPIFYREFPLETLQSNYIGSLNALEYARTRDAKILLMSSSEIYGDPTPENIPTSETYRGNVSSIGVRACYDEGKRVMETLAWIYSSKFEMDISIARPFNFYGPGMRIDDGRILPDMFKSFLLNSNIVLYSDGKPTRSFCYVRDAIIALFLMLLSDKHWKLYNVGNTETEISMSELAELTASIARSFGWRGLVDYELHHEKDYLINNPNRRSPATDLINSELSWNAKVPLAEGIERSLLHFKEL